MLEFLTIVGFAILVALAIALVLLFSAVLLRAAVSLYNRFVGGNESPRAVAIPSHMKAIGILLAIGLINGAIGTGVEQIADLSGAEWLAGTELVRDGSFSMSFGPLNVLHFILTPVLLAWLLPTRFFRAMGVSVCHSVICFAVAAVAIGLGLAGAMLVEQLLA